jgi:hypothetical protein
VPGRLLLAGPLLALAACDSQAPEPPLDHAVVRVENQTGVDLDSVSVRLLALEPPPSADYVDHRRSFGPLADGATSPYLVFEGTHQYTLTNVHAYGVFRQSLSAQRDDDDIYDPFLGPGRYTYRIAGEFYDTFYLSPRFLEPDGAASEVEVRVENETAMAFDETTVWFRGPELGVAEEVAYGPLAPGAVSDYVAVPHTFPYAPFRVVSSGDTLRYRVADYDGVEPVGPGRYTLAIRRQVTTGFRDETVLIREGDR